jgi:hypothetical protein
MNPSPRRGNWPQKQRRLQLGQQNARQQYERYLAGSPVAGDVVEMENYYQHVPSTTCEL